MANYSRLIKQFSATTKRIYDANGAARTEKPDQAVDDKVNAWVKESGNIIMQAVASRHTTIDKRQDGGLVRKTSTTITVIYMQAAEFLEAEVDIRRRAMLGDGAVAPKVLGDGGRTAVSDEEERRLDKLDGAELGEKTVSPTKPNDYSVKTEHTVGGPAAAAEAAMATDGEDD